MIGNLEKFVELDIPFLISERRERIEFLKDTLDRADVSVAEKFSQVLQAYQVENTYGTTIEAYTDVIELEGKSRQVDMLKWGRVSLVFQTPDAESTGVWNNEARQWVMLPDNSGLAFVTDCGLHAKPRQQTSFTYPYRLQENNP
jgi:hypothetical protein